MSIQRTLLIARLLLCSLLIGIPSSRAVAKNPVLPSQAVVIAVEKFEKCAPVENADVDSKIIGDTLEQRCGYEVFKPMSGESARSLAGMITRRAKDVNPGAKLITFYYRGRAYEHDGRLYLAAADCQPSDPGQGCLALDDVLLRLSYCASAEFIALAIDVVAEIGQKDAIERAVQAAVNGVPASSPDIGVVVSLEPEETGRRHAESVLAHRLARHLKRGGTVGNAKAFSFEQLSRALLRDTDVAPAVCFTVSRGDTTGVPLVVQRPRQLDEAIADLADRLSEQLHGNAFAVAAVSDPTGDQSNQVPEVLARYFSQRLRHELARRANSHYRIIAGEPLRTALQDEPPLAQPFFANGVEARKLHQRLSSRFLAGKPSEPIAVIVPSLQLEQDTNVSVSAAVHATPTGRLMPVAGVQALLQPSEWMMTGNSGSHRPPNRTRLVTTRRSRLVPLPEFDFSEASEVKLAREYVRHLRTSKLHPLEDNNFPFDVGITTPQYNRYKHDASDDNQHVSVVMTKGQGYWIYINNPTSQGVFLRLFVDGLNTLPDTPIGRRTGDFVAVSHDLNQEVEPAPVVNPITARAWYCKPKSEFVVRGFYLYINRDTTEDKTDGSYASFVVTDPEKSEAWRKNYYQDVGIITAAFYLPKERPQTLGASSPLGTSLGDVHDTTVELYRGDEVPGDLLGVVNIRYGME